MTRKTCIILLILLLSATSTACEETSTPSISYDPKELSFSGKRAFAIEDEFVTTFTNRHSGTNQSQLSGYGNNSQPQVGPARWMNGRSSTTASLCL